MPSQETSQDDPGHKEYLRAKEAREFLITFFKEFLSRPDPGKRPAGRATMAQPPNGNSPTLGIVIAGALAAVDYLGDDGGMQIGGGTVSFETIAEMARTRKLAIAADPAPVPYSPELPAAEFISSEWVEIPRRATRRGKYGVLIRKSEPPTAEQPGRPPESPTAEQPGGPEL